jgi:16S rRNA (uracil1498-N3)-methyltransferase
MRRRFFVEQVRNGHADILGSEAVHLTRVLRVEAGRRYEISDDRDVYLAEVEMARWEHVRFRVIEKLPPAPAAVRLRLCAALVKFDHFEWMIEKATELGVAEIVPFEAARSERGLERAAMKRIERWRKITLEASQQSRREHLPEVREPVEFEQALAEAAAFRYVLDEEPGGAPLLATLPSERKADDTVSLLIGPEGGWTNEERSAFLAAGWTRVSLGPLVLRAETAALAGLAVLAQAWASG